jgi:hypothetical protein
MTIGLKGLWLHQTADKVTGFVILAMAIFSPWAFGCANSKLIPNWSVFGCPQTWTVWTMNFAGYSLGALLTIKLLVRWCTGYRPPRWTATSVQRAGDLSPRTRWPQIATWTLATLTVLTILYCLVSAVNAASQYRSEQFQFEYFDSYIAWLPHSFNRISSWTAFWNYLALAFSFWAAWDWLSGKTANEARAERKSTGENSNRVALLPGRLRRLLWVLSLNGGLLAAEGIIQRLTGSTKLLWLVQPRVNPAAIDHFGPFSYRANAAQYFNLLWPVALGFWWTLRRSAQMTAERNGRPARWGHLGLLPGILLMAVCPIISYSRGGAIIGLMGILVAALIVFTALRQSHGATKLGMILFVLAILGIGFALGGEKLGERMKDFDQGLSGREHIYEVAHGMADEHPLFGTGPGTFEVLFQFYRTSVEEYWPAQLHNDWLETRITFGWLGSAFIAAAFLIVVTRRFLPGGIQCGWRFPALLWLGLATCLVHARFDFPFQIYSIVFLFLIICAILFNLSRANKSGK